MRSYGDRDLRAEGKGVEDLERRLKARQNCRTVTCREGERGVIMVGQFKLKAREVHFHQLEYKEVSTKQRL